MSDYEMVLTLNFRKNHCDYMLTTKRAKILNFLLHKERECLVEDIALVPSKLLEVSFIRSLFENDPESLTPCFSFRVFLKTF